MNTIENIEDRLNNLLNAYGDGKSGASPTKAQWSHILQRPVDQPVTLVNFFKFSVQAIYGDPQMQPCSGRDAFDCYASVSMPAMQKAGGRFLLVAPFEVMFAGDDEDWDLIAIGSYPDTSALLRLFEDKAYQAIFHHRMAACAMQKVVLCNG